MGVSRLLTVMHLKYRALENMNYLRRLWQWIMKPWPLHMFPLAIYFHFYVIDVFPENIEVINLWVSTIFQLVGGILILVAIDGNLNVISNSSIKNTILGWFREFPRKARHHSIEGGGKFISLSGGKARLSFTPSMDTLDKKVEYLFQEIKRLDEQQNEVRKEVHERIHKSEKRILSIEKMHGQEIKEIKNKLSKVLVGSVKVEVFGVLCVVYGLIIPVIWYA